MRAIDINLSSTDTINSFLNTVSKFDDDLYLKSGAYMINARSLIGIFVCDLSKPVTLLIHYNEDEIVPALKQYMAA